MTSLCIHSTASLPLPQENFLHLYNICLLHPIVVTKNMENIPCMQKFLYT